MILRQVLAISLMCAAASPAFAELRDARFRIDGDEGVIWLGFDAQPDAVRLEETASGVRLDIGGIDVDTRLISPRDPALASGLRVEPAETGGHVYITAGRTWHGARAELRQGGVLVTVHLSQAAADRAVETRGETVLAAAMPAETHDAAPSEAAPHGRPASATAAGMPSPDHTADTATAAGPAHLSPDSRDHDPAPHGEPGSSDPAPRADRAEPAATPAADTSRTDTAPHDTPARHDGAPAEHGRVPDVEPGEAATGEPGPDAPAEGEPGAEDVHAEEAVAEAEPAEPAAPALPDRCTEVAAQVDADPWDDENLMEHAACRARAGYVDEAASIYQQMLAFNPENATAALALADIRLSQGDEEAARELFDQAAMYARSDAEAARAMALQRELRGN